MLIRRAIQYPHVLHFVVGVAVLSSVALARPSTPSQAGQGANASVGGSVVAGTVTSDGNQPIAGVTVRAVSRVVLAGDQAVRYAVQTTVRTDSRGEYRFNLPPGEYLIDVPLTQMTIPESVIVASVRGTATGSEIRQRIADSLGPPAYFSGPRVGAYAFQTMGPQGPAPAPRGAPDNGVSVYASTIFPNVRTTREARVISIRAPETVRADIRLPAVRGMKVSGSLTGASDEIAFMTLRLLPVLDDLELFRDADFEEAITVTDQRGGFTFLGVPAGRYTLMLLYVPSVLPGATATGGRGEPARVGIRGGGSPTPAAMDLVRWAEAIVDVRGADVAGLTVALKPAIRVAGTIRAASAASLDLSPAQIMLFSNRPVTIAPPAPVAVAADGSFSARVYGPGLYRAQVSGVPGFVTAGLSAGTAPASPWLSVTGDDVSGVTVMLSAQPTGRAGGVSAARGAPPSAPAPPPSPENAFVAGRVIDGATGLPIPNATVMLQRSGDPATSRRVMLTDESGGFTFGDAVAGSYLVTSSAPGYSPGAFGRMRPDGPTSSLGLAARERVGSMTIRMWKPGAISGRVQAAGGKPIGGLSLVTLRVTELGRRRDYTLHSVARTDPTGAYRFSGLPSGDYLVCASFTPTTIPESLHQTFRQNSIAAGRGGSPLASMLAESRAPIPSAAGVLIGTARFVTHGPDSNVAPAPSPVSPTGTVSVYGSGCHPSAAVLAEATEVRVESGNERESINLALPALSTVMVSGTVRGPAGPVSHLGLRLIRASGRNEYLIGSERLEAAAAVSDDRGAFSFLGVPAGDYLLRAWTTHVQGQTPPAAPPIGRPPARQTGVTLWAEVPVTVRASSLSDLVVTLVPTARVSGRVIWEGSTDPPVALPLALWTRQQFDPPLPLASNVLPDGTFTLVGYAPGHYSLPTNSGSPWRVTSATLNGKLLPGHAIDLTSADVSNLVLTATDRFTTLSGQVEREPGMAPVDAMLVIFPRDYRSWFAEDMSSTRMRWFRPSGNWTYTATWLPDGEYLAIVYREADGAELTPAFVERLAKLATPVAIRSGEKTTLDLRVVNIR